MTRRTGGFRCAGPRAVRWAWLLVPFVTALAVSAAAQDRQRETAAATPRSLSTSVVELERWSERLGSDGESDRQTACAALGSLEEEALPAIRDRLETLGRHAASSDEVYRVLRRFGHAVGSLRADDVVDIAPGVPAALREDASGLTVRVAEELLLLRSLERMRTAESGRAITDLLGQDPRAWRWEAKLLVQRMGRAALPMLIEARGHRVRGVRRWARWGLEELGAEEPGKAIQQEDGRLLADVIRAYGRTHDMQAMSILVSLVTHDRAQVRQAARWSTREYGRNAIWQLRQGYRNLTGENAGPMWGWRRTMDALFAASDARRLSTVRAELEAGLAGAARGDLRTMRRRFDEALRRAPALPWRARMAPGYARSGKAAMAQGDWAESERLYRRALRLDPTSRHSREWRAQVLYIDAGRSLASGVADIAQLRATLALAPRHAGARAALEALTRAPNATSVVLRRRIALGLAALLCALLAWMLLRWHLEEPRRTDATAPESADQTPDILPG